jgi:MSHA biogenesis protein MshP
MNDFLFPIRVRRSAGIGLVTAVFLLVVLAALGVAMVVLTTSQQVSSMLDVQGTRAYQAARAGVEWGVYKQLQQQDCDKNPGNYPVTFQFPANTSLSTFSVTVSCTKKQVSSGNSELSRYTIRAVACNKPSGSCPNASNSQDYVQRVVEVQI